MSLLAKARATLLFPEDDRCRYGRDPDPRDAAHLRDYIAGADEHHVPLHPSVADRAWDIDQEDRPNCYGWSPSGTLGEAAEDEAGDA
jgi:hypothetical protein